MPKIVDHQAHREELAKKAVEYFFQCGYAGSSMRDIAQFLGVSKSALYHYFPSKDALFLAATEQVMSRFAGLLRDTEGTQQQRIQQLMHALRPDFGKDLTIVLEYMRGKPKEEIADDEAMRIALKTYFDAVKPIVRPDKVEQTVALILGTLLVEFYKGEI